MSENRAPTVASQLNRDLSNPQMRAQLEAALPEHVSVDKFCRTVMTAIQSSPLLLQADRTTVLKSCMEAAADGLLPDGREGAIVPYKNGRTNKWEAQWQPMVWGLVKLVRNSGELKSIGAEIVRTGDAFERWIDENGAHFKHTPSMSGEGAPVGVYAYAITRDGGVYIEYMTWAEIEKFKKLSKAAEGPWKTWPEEMAKVRPIKRLCKRLPMSTDALAAFERDDARDAANIAGVTADPIAALNASIAGATPPAGSTPALEHNPTPSFAEVSQMIGQAATPEQLAEVENLIASVEDDPDGELVELAKIRRDMLQQQAPAEP